MIKFEILKEKFMDLKINDAAVKKLESKTDTELAKSFLVKKKYEYRYYR